MTYEEKRQTVNKDYVSLNDYYQHSDEGKFGKYFVVNSFVLQFISYFSTLFFKIRFLLLQIFRDGLNISLSFEYVITEGKAVFANFFI